jgi:hypothetical protein
LLAPGYRRKIITLKSRNHPYHGREDQWNRVANATREGQQMFLEKRTVGPRTKAMLSKPTNAMKLVFPALAAAMASIIPHRRRM